MKLDKKNMIKLAIVTIVAIIIALVAIIPINSKYEKKLWMKDLANDTIISDMSIPGTHDSGATRSIFDVAGKCQDMSIVNQLKIGVRFLDLRLQLVNDELRIVHSFVDQKLLFKKVLKDISEFIKENSSEFIIVSIKEDADSKKTKVTFYDKVIEELSKYDNISFDDTLPTTLGEARGKIYILNRFTSNDIGIKAYHGWKDSTSFELGDLYVQDNYCLESVDIKKQDILNTFDYSLTSNKLVLNFTSCYLENSFPPTYAATPAKDINKWLIEEINKKDKKLGIVIVDFITEELASAIYKVN